MRLDIYLLLPKGLGGQVANGLTRKEAAEFITSYRKLHKDTVLCAYDENGKHRYTRPWSVTVIMKGAPA